MAGSLLQRPASKDSSLFESAVGAGVTSGSPEVTEPYAVAATPQTLLHYSPLAKQPPVTVQDGIPARTRVQRVSAVTDENLSKTSTAGIESIQPGPARFGLVRSPFYGNLGDPYQFWDDGATRAGVDLLKVINSCSVDVIIQPRGIVTCNKQVPFCW